MGIVIKQAGAATVLNYFGIVLGFVNVTLLMNRWFEPSEFGLTRVLLDMAVLFTQVAHLGTYRSVIKFLPLYRTEDKANNGLLSLVLLVPLVGFLILGTALIILEPHILEQYNESSTLLNDYFWYLFPLAFFLLYSNVLESYLQAHAQTIYTAFLKFIFARVTVTVGLVLYFYDVINFKEFMAVFCLMYALNVVLLLLYMFNQGLLKFKMNKAYFRKRMLKVYFNYSFFSILSGIANAIVTKIDAIMLGGFFGLALAGVYANAAYVSILVFIPASAIARISAPLVSQDWKNKNMANILVMYQKTALVQLILGGLLLIVIWCSVDNFFALQKPQYAAGKTALLLLGLSKVVNMAFGVNGQIINISRYYRFDALTSFLLAILVVVTNLLFIPEWGLEGAAAATLLSITAFNVVRCIFLYRKLDIHPFTIQMLWALVILGVGLAIGTYLPKVGGIFIDTFVRSSAIALVAGGLLLYFRVAPDINVAVMGVMKRLGFK